MGDCRNGIEVEIKIECGAVTTKNFCQTELQLELGSVATAFEIRPVSQEEFHCQYYMRKSCLNAIGSVAGGDEEIWISYAMIGRSNGFVFSMVPLSTKMRAAPTLVIWSITGTVGSVTGSTNGSTIADVAPTSTTAYRDKFRIVKTGYTPGDLVCFEFHYAVFAEL